MEGRTAEIAAELAASRERLRRHRHETGRDDENAGGTASRLDLLLSRLGARLTRPPRVVLLGEFNAGKSTLANALIGSELLPTSIHANSRVPIHIHYSAETALSCTTADGRRHPLTLDADAQLPGGSARMLCLGLPVDRLRRFELIDTPGLASGSERFDELVIEACRRSHIAIWCTSGTQAWKATEVAAWGAVPARLRRRALLAVTRLDMLVDEQHRSRLQARLDAETPEFRGRVLVDAVEAYNVRRDHAAADHDARWRDCGGAALEALLDGLILVEVAARHAAVERVLQRALTRLAGGSREESEAGSAV
jgi:hypothetical protein